MTCRQFIVTGRVQGVFFRVSARDVAVRLGLSGHAINLPDGGVEVLACGDPHTIAELERWLATGPPMASVSGVESIEIECAEPLQFTVG